MFLKFEVFKSFYECDYIYTQFIWIHIHRVLIICLKNETHHLQYDIMPKRIFDF